MWDVGGQEKLRQLWSHYYSKSKGLIYVVDCSDSERIHLAGKELQNIVNHEEMQEAVVLILANKRDKATMSVEYLSQQLGVMQFKRNWAIFPTTAVNERNSGLEEAMQWLIDNIDHTEKPIRRFSVG